MDFSCVIPSKCVLLQMVFCSCVIVTTFFWEVWQIAFLNCKKTWWSKIKQLLNLVIAEYRDLWVELESRSIIIVSPPLTNRDILLIVKNISWVWLRSTASVEQRIKTFLVLDKSSLRKYLSKTAGWRTFDCENTRNEVNAPFFFKRFAETETEQETRRNISEASKQ